MSVASRKNDEQTLMLCDQFAGPLSKFMTPLTNQNLSLNFQGRQPIFLDAPIISVQYFSSSVILLSIATNVVDKEICDFVHGQLAVLMSKNN